MSPTKPTIVELEMNKLEEIRRRLEAKDLDAGDYETIQAVVESYIYLVQTLGDKETTIRRLRQMLFGAKTEKTSAVIGGLQDANSESASPEGEGLPELPANALSERGAEAGADAQGGGSTEAAGPSGGDAEEENGSPIDGEARPQHPGHGRNGAESYTGGEKIEVPHESLRPGDACPKCEKGTVYETGRPGVVVRLVGQAPVGAMVYYLQKLRCNLCGVVFTAEAPAEMGEAKYDATAGSMMAVLKYGTGMPFHRLEGLQAGLGIPLPASTQWDVMEAQAKRAEPVFDELVRQAAQGDVVYHDDTGVKILEVMKERARQAGLAEDEAAGTARAASTAGQPAATLDGSGEVASNPASELSADRTGTFTTGIVSTRSAHGSPGHKIALFLSGRRHAGENLRDVLARRAVERPPPIQMCDPLSRNMPRELKTILANCLAHGRRQFVDVAKSFPAECCHVLEALAVVYKNDAKARKRELSAEERLRFHQAESGPIMEKLHAWLEHQIEDRRVEPNSGLGKAIQYLLRHWEPLTLFLRVPGAPLDNNVCERALKKAILHRKNALFYKTCHGAHVGDTFMSLIYTCELGGVNPLDYLTELDRHAAEASLEPGAWMPWNYRETLAALSAP